MASGEGTTLQALIDAQSSASFKPVVALVISNNSGSGALRRARAAGIPAVHLSSITHPESGALERAFLEAASAHEIDSVLLSGYLKKVGPEILARFRGNIFNTHPSLLPRHGGQGMYGRRVHEAVLASGETVTGVSLHLVDYEYDTGAVLAQTQVSVAADETVESLMEKVQALERSFLCAALDRLARQSRGVSSNPSIERTA